MLLAKSQWPENRYFSIFKLLEILGLVVFAKLA
jgi:hypothetical protein